MKKFFKALALVLALALVVGVVPVTTANAATVKKSKTIYVGGANGESTDGKTSKYKSRVAIYKLAGYTKDTKGDHTFKAVAQKDDGIVSITKKYVTASALGKAKVDIYVDGEKVGTTEIVCKKNATEDTLTITGVVDEFVVAGKYTFTLPRAGKDTDERRLYINGELVADEAGAPRTYTHTFVKDEIGDVTIKYEAYQSAKLDKAIVSKEVKAKVVAPTPTAIKQTAHNAFELTFDSNIEVGGYYANLKDWETEQAGVANDIYYKLNDVKVPFSSVKATTPKENVLKVTMYGSFVGGETYYVQIAGKTFDFEAAGNTAKYVTALEFTSSTALVNTNAKIKYKLLNAVGIDITDTALVDGSIEFETKDTDKAFVTENTIYFYKVGEKANVTGTFTYYDVDDNYKAYPTTNSAVLTAVEQAPVYKTATWSINKASLAGTNVANGGWACWNGQDYLPLGDDDSYVNVYATFTVGSDDYDIILGGLIPVIEKPLKVKVADEHYAMITNNLNGDLQPVKAGATSFLLYYTTDDEKDIVVASLPFRVTEKRKATTITAAAKNVNTGTPFLNTDLVNYIANEEAGNNDQIKLYVTVKDQYGKNYPANDVKFVQRADSVADANGTAAVRVLDADDNGGVLFSANQAGGVYTLSAGTDFPALGTNVEKVASYNVTAQGLSTVVSFRVKKAGVIDEDKSSIVPYISGTTINTTLTATGNWDYCYDQEAHLNYMNGSYFAGRVKFFLTDENVTTGKDLQDYVALIENGANTAGLHGATNGSIYVARVIHGSTVLDIANGGLALTTTGTKYKNDRLNVIDLADSLTLRSNGAATLGGAAVGGSERARWQFDFDAINGDPQKLHSGSYTLMFYKITDDNNLTDDKCKVTPIGSKALTVTDNQSANLPAIKQLKQVIDSAASADIAAAYEIKWNGSVANVVAVDADNNIKQDAGAVYVYDIEVSVQPYAKQTQINYTFVVPVGELLNIK